MRRLLILFSAVLLVGPMTACDTFVSEVDSPKDSAPEVTFTSPQDINFLANGVKTQGADATAFLTVTSGLLSDQLRFGQNSDATFPTFADPDRGRPSLQNTSVGDATRALGEYRRLADNLVEAAERPETYPSGAPITEQEAKFIGQFHGAIARYYYATYTGLGPRNGGGVIDESKFIPSPAMYDSARVKFNRALELAPTAKDSANVRSVHARSALYAGTQFGRNTSGYNDALQRAAELASDGLKAGDAPFLAEFSTQEPNYWWEQAGPSRYQIVAMDDTLNPIAAGTHKDLSQIRSFKEVIANNPSEERRLPFALKAYQDADGNVVTEFGQTKYAVESSPTPIISWEEVNLIRAELELRGENAGMSSALDLVNEVRADGTLPGRGIDEITVAFVGQAREYTINRIQSFDLSPLGSVNLAQLAVERDRTLFGQGQRLPDQRRLSAVDWHLVDSAPSGKTWKWLPLTSQERDNNPNL